MAEAKGGYPIGYIIVAKDLGLLKGIEETYNKEISRGNIVKMLDKALNCYLMKQVSYGEKEEYSIFDGLNGIGLETLETQYHSDSNFFFLDINNNIILSNEDISLVSTDSEKEGDYFYLEFELKEGVTKRFAETTGQIADYKDEENILRFVYRGEVIAQPRITEKIESGKIRIVGEFNKTYTQEIVKEINKDNISE